MAGHDRGGESAAGTAVPPAGSRVPLTTQELVSMYLTGTFVGVANAAVFHPMDVLRIRCVWPRRIYFNNCNKGKDCLKYLFHEIILFLDHFTVVSWDLKLFVLFYYWISLIIYFTERTLIVVEGGLLTTRACGRSPGTSSTAASWAPK